MIKYILIFFTILLSLKLYSQKISGKITDENGKIIENVIISFFDTASNFQTEFCISKNGKYEYLFKNKYKLLIIKINALNYQKLILKKNMQPENDIILDIVLRKDTNIDLKEVVIKAKRSPVIVRDDTTTYTVDYYKTGSDLKIQDVIKKLPGIEIDPKTGVITYKGKSIETVMLDGDNLFSNNYTIGTKNINVNVIEKIQAIENYSENPLLKNVNSENKVALNLILKSRKSELTGDVETGIGVSNSKLNKFDISNNLIGISKKNKFFSVLSYNNVGTNYSPFNYFSNNNSTDDLKELKYYSRKIIQENNISNQFDDIRNNLNNSNFGSINYLRKINKNHTIKLSLSLNKEKINSNIHSKTINNFDSFEIITSENKNLTTRPNVTQLEFNYIFNTSTKSNFSFTSKLKDETIKTTSDLLQNGLFDLKSTLKSTSLFQKNTITFTNKINYTTALQIIATNTKNNINQNFNFKALNDLLIIIDSNSQLVNLKKSINDIKLSLLGNLKKITYQLITGFNIEINTFNSEFSNNDTSNSSFTNKFKNLFEFKKKYFYTAGVISMKSKKVNISLTLSSNFLMSELKDFENYKILNLKKNIFEPQLRLSYKINNFNFISYSFNKTQKLFNEDYLYSNPIYINNRFQKSNEVNLNLQKSYSNNIYFIYKSKNNKLEFKSGFNSNVIDGNYFSNTYILLNKNKNNLIYLPLIFKNNSFNFSIEKYFSSLTSTIRLSNNFFKNDYKNIVNNSTLRNNDNTIINSEFFFKTAFNLKLNFENNLILNSIKSKSNDKLVFKNSTLRNQFNVIFKINSDLFMLLKSDFFYINKNQKILFLDYNLNYKISKLSHLRVVVNNILNYKNYNEVMNDDFSTTNTKSNLQERFLLIKYSINL